MKNDTVPLMMTALMLIVFSVLLTPLVLAQNVGNITNPVAMSEGKSDPEVKQVQEDQNLSETVEYNLPYPGILNDHPLYFLKKFRDQFLDFIISDPLKKAEFYLLQSDKFLAMSMMHESTKNYEQLLITAQLSADFLQKTVNKIMEIRKDGVMPSALLTEKVIKSKIKHNEVFLKMGKSIEESNLKIKLESLNSEINKASLDF